MPMNINQSINTDYQVLYFSNSEKMVILLLQS